MGVVMHDKKIRPNISSVCVPEFFLSVSFSSGFPLHLSSL
jgi:hypothetical protein